MIKVQAYLLSNTGERPIGDKTTIAMSNRELLGFLQKVANYYWGAEGKQYRIVQDQTVIGFHAKEIATGNCIELR